MKLHLQWSSVKDPRRKFSIHEKVGRKTCCKKVFFIPLKWNKSKGRLKLGKGVLYFFLFCLAFNLIVATC